MSEYVKIVVGATPDYIKVSNPAPPTYIKVNNGQLVEIEVEVVPYTKVLSGFSVSVLEDEHEIHNVRGLRVCNPGGELVEVKETYNGNDIQIDSNVLLDDHILTIY